MSVQLTRFKNDALGFDSFEGYTKGENWNGWDCPYFTFEQAQRVLQTYNQLRSITGEAQGYYDAGADAFIFPAEDEPEIYNAITSENEKYYPVGAFCWIWEKAGKFTLENDG